MPSPTGRLSGGFGFGLLFGVLLSVTLYPLTLRLGLGGDASRAQEATAKAKVETARREIAEKTVEVLQHIAIAHGSRSRCSESSRELNQLIGSASNAAEKAARAAAALDPTNTKGGSATRLPSSHGASSLKIYVYNLPADFNTNMLDSRLPRKFDCRASMYAAEVLIHEQLLRSSHRTENPDEADLFYVPVYMTCYRSLLQYAARVRLRDRVGILRGRGLTVEATLFEFFHSLLDFLRDEYPFWDRQNGRDHVFTFTHDYGACFTYLEADTFKPERLEVQHALHNAILLQYLGDLRSPCFQTWKDVVIPPLVTNRKLLALAGGGGVNATDVASRSIGAYFRGKVEYSTGKVDSFPEYGRGVRAVLKEQFTNHTFFAIHDGHSSGYIAELAGARFCIAPPGFALWSPRLSEAVIAGCIPVVIGDGIELPFEELIDYASFIVRVPERDVPRLADILLRLPSSALRMRAAAMRQHWRRFTYNDEKVPGDAFDSIIATLWLRMRNHRPVATFESPMM